MKHCYFVSDYIMYSWDEARSKCQELGGQLTIIKTAQKQAGIEEYLTGKLSSEVSKYHKGCNIVSRKTNMTNMTKRGPNLFFKYLFFDFGMILI